ncbi:hypothetical protein V6N13_129655 [Hibiscus sabdariffa]|uniref:Uncharacterized protein n=1 Tax=Hibiscus sabdariffa TaxID=183260 RepID=A0ABR2SMD4_9ROSI
MSRCFPYTPPGHLRHGLVESIKLERGTVIPKSELKPHRKSEKKRKKEKRKDKNGKDKSQCLPKNFKKLDDVLNVYKDGDQLERSDLTEEHEPPVCYISDGSQNCHKRKRETTSHSEGRVDGNKIKIRFSLKKPCFDASISKESACSSSGRAYSNQELNFSVASMSRSKLLHDNGKKVNGISSEPSCSADAVPQLKLLHDDGRKVHGPSSEPSCSVAPVPRQKVCRDVEMKVKRPSSRTLANENKILKAVLQYKALIEDWVPPLLQPELNDYDSGDDWLLPKKQLGKPAAKRSDDYDVLCASCSSSWPQAHYLPEAEIYALPYTVPF